MTEVDIKTIFTSQPHLPTKPLLLAVKRGNIGTLTADMENFNIQEIARKYSDKKLNVPTYFTKGRFQL
jgi:hypothetical protein